MNAVAPFPTTVRQMPGPSNLEAEAALLGALLIANDLVESVSKHLAASDFFDPLHRRIYEATVHEVAAGRVASPVTLNGRFAGDLDMKALGGGSSYMARLTADGQGLFAPVELAVQIATLAARRRRLEWLAEQTAATGDLSEPLADLSPPVELAISAPLEALDLAALASIDPEPKQFIIPRLAPAGEVTLFTGAGAVGKSLLAQQLATSLAVGRPTLGLDLRQSHAIYLTAEDDPDQLHWRQAQICKALSVDMRSLAGSLFLISRRGEPCNFLATLTEEGLQPTRLFREIASLQKRSGAGAIFLDNVAHLFPGDENDRSEVTRFVNQLNRLASETGAAIILLGHPNKTGATYSGSTAWLNAVRSQISMERPAGSEHDPDLRAIQVGKPNYARAGEALRCRWMDWAFVRDEDLPQHQRDELAETIAASSENAAFLACLRARAEQGDGRAVGPSPSSNYAPAQFEGMQEAKGFNKAALKRAMDRLFSIGKIESFTYRNTAKGRDVTVIREVSDVTPNAFPNASRTLSPDIPEPYPDPARTIPAHTPPSTKGGGGAPQGGPRASPRTKGDDHGQ